MQHDLKPNSNDIMKMKHSTINQPSRKQFIKTTAPYIQTPITLA